MRLLVASGGSWIHEDTEVQAKVTLALDFVQCVVVHRLRYGTLRTLADAAARGKHGGGSQNRGAG